MFLICNLQYQKQLALYSAWLRDAGCYFWFSFFVLKSYFFITISPKQKNSKKKLKSPLSKAKRQLVAKGQRRRRLHRTSLQRKVSATSVNPRARIGGLSDTKRRSPTASSNVQPLVCPTNLRTTCQSNHIRKGLWIWLCDGSPRLLQQRMIPSQRDMRPLTFAHAP